MRIMHTADWHVGKKLGRIDRTAEFEQALDEIVDIARDQKVDLVIVAGDLLDRTVPPVESLSLVIDGLIRLADVAGRVVAMPGNHDAPAMFQLLSTLLEPRGITLVPRIVRPSDGGVIEVASRDGTSAVSVGVFPFLNEAQVVDFMEAGTYEKYADRVRGICSALCEGFDPRLPGILVGHFFIDKAELGGGERLIHIGDQYAATPQSLPSGAAYVALGHIHRPQSIPGAAIPSRYSGSILPLDFSERTHKKEVVIVEALSGRPAKVKSIQLASGRRLLRVEDELDNLKARVGELKDAYLDVRVRTAGPVFGLAEQVREFLPDAVMVQAVYEKLDDVVAIGAHDEQTLVDAYAGFHESAHKVPAPAELLEVLRELEGSVRAPG